ncbi:MAG: response regulator transcription factor [Acidimicrobiales bacterium]|nr:response regulator transcription factor [Acidimicrobiales bacterium]
MEMVLVVEDDQHIRSAIVRGLTGAGYTARGEATASAALSAVVEWSPTLVVLDLGLPDMDGGDVLRMLRGITDIPVIIATARDDEREMVRLLDAGADDYVVKPYSTEQLAARIRAVVRRRGIDHGPEDRIEVDGLVVDSSRRVATIDGASLDLSRLEFDLLSYLAKRSPAVVSRQELMAEVWNQPFGGSDKTVDVHLSWLRRKLGETASAPRLLWTIRGVGVKLESPQP